MHLEKLFLLIFATLLSCGPARSEREENTAQISDIGANFNGTFVYYLEDDLLVKGTCPNNVILSGRAQCQEKLQKIASWMFFAHMDRVYLENVAEKDQQRLETVLLLEDIYRKISLLLDAEPQQNSSLRPRINQKIEELTDIESLVVGLRDQIFRIESELRHQDHPDLRTLLHNLEIQLSAKLATRNAAQAELAELRQQHHDLNGSIISTETFVRLIRQRNDAQYGLRNAEFQLKKSTDYLEAWISAVRFLRDSDIWRFSQTDSPEDLVSKVIGGFGQDYRTLQFRGQDLQTEGNAAFFRIAAAEAKTSFLRVAYNDPGSGCTGLKLSHRNFTVTTNKVSISATSESYPPELAPLFSEKVTGIVNVEPICRGDFDLKHLSGSMKVVNDYYVN